MAVEEEADSLAGALAAQAHGGRSSATPHSSDR